MIDENKMSAEIKDLKVLFISGAEGGTRRYRCFHQQEQLELYGIATGFRTSDDLRLYQDVLTYDIFVLHRVAYNRLIRDILELAHKRGKITIFETDDLIFEPDLVHYDGFYRSLRPPRTHQYEQGVRDHLKTLQQCDYALTTTDYLADALRRRGKQVLINRNALSSEFVYLAQEIPVPKPKSADDRVTLGYISGSTSHDRDFATVSDALCYVLGKHPHVELRIIGPLNLDRRLASLQRQVQLTPLIPWQDVPYAIRDLDINLAPLEQENPFCQSKSEVKYFEAGILGVPTVASRTEAFEYAIRHGETGFLASGTAEWIQSLELLITDPEYRQAVGRAAHRDALENYTPQVRGKQFVETLHALAAIHQPPTAPLYSDEQAQHRLIDILLGYLREGTDRAGPWRLPHSTHEPTAPQPVPFSVLESALRVVHQARRRPGAQIVAWAKHLAKKLARRVYRMEMDGEIYQLIDELTGGQVYGQTFQADAPNLCRVDVLFATFGRVNSPNITFRLKASPTAKEDLVAQTVSASLLQDNRFCRFAFEPILDSAGKQYCIFIESPDAVRGDAVGLWTHSQTSHAEGTMYKNGRPTALQLAHRVHYGY